jgi:hypothetical protein
MQTNAEVLPAWLDMQAEKVHPDMLKAGSCLRDLDQLCLYYCRRIFAMVASLRQVRLRVATTACTYFHRFYHTQSMIERDPRVVSVACVYLAGMPYNFHRPPLLAIEYISHLGTLLQPWPLHPLSGSAVMHSHLYLYGCHAFDSCSFMQ